jgi:glutaredoxin
MNVKIYSKENCSYCTSAKMLLSNKGISYTELKLNEDFTSENLKQLYPNARTFPIIVVDGFNIGGFTELQKMITEETKDNRKFLSEGAI